MQAMIDKANLAATAAMYPSMQQDSRQQYRSPTPTMSTYVNYYRTAAPPPPSPQSHASFRLDQHQQQQQQQQQPLHTSSAVYYRSSVDAAAAAASDGSASMHRRQHQQQPQQQATASHPAYQAASAADLLGHGGRAAAAASYHANLSQQIKQQQQQQQHLLSDYVDHSRYGEVTPEMIGQRKRPSLLSEFHPSPAMSSSMKEASRQALVMPPTSIMQSMHHVQPQDLGPYANKRPRLNTIDGRPDLQQPLRIDTRDIDMKREPAYTPQVEAISPTPMDDPVAKNSHAELLSNLEKLDRDIQTHENKIQMLQKKKQQLEEKARMPPEERPASPAPSYLEGYHSLAQIIYSKNRHISHQAHEALNKLGPPVDLPLYNQPSDAAIFADNIAKFAAIKKRLILFFRRRQRVRNIREKYLMDRYEQMMKSWTKKMERIENSTRRRAKDAKAREIFEKVFPEIKKQREDKERLQRVGANRVGVARSDADLEQIADGLHEQEEEERKMRSLAVIPPLLLDIKQRQLRYANKNGILDDPMTYYKNRQLCNVWTQAEKNIFREKFLLHPKNFTFISSFLQQKSVSDCVQYYYLSKKTENYKQLVRKQARKKGGTRLTRPQDEGENSLGTSTTTVNQQECQLGTCKTPKRKVKQLRPLPASFADLPAEQREEMMKEYQIPEGITKCCAACYNRIMRRIGAGAAPAEPAEGPSELAGDEPVATGPWTQDEIDTAVTAFREHGRNWSAIAAAVKTRTEQQCMDFYKLQLHTEKKPAAEDEEKKAENDKDIRQSVCESIASTVTAPSEVDMMSSDDEHDESSDTASASSPGPPPVGGPPPLPPPSSGLPPSSSSLPNSNDHFLADKPPRAVGDDDRAAGLSGGGAPLLPVLTTSRASVHSNVDNDSSATMSADEGPPTESSITISGPSVSGSHGHPSGRHQTPAAAAASSEVRKAVCMRDVIHSTIEQSVQENSGFPGGLPKYYSSAAKEFPRSEQRPDLSRVIHLAPPSQASPAHMVDGRHSTSPVPLNNRTKFDALVYRGDPREIYPRSRPRDDSTPPPAAHSHHARPASGAPNMATSLDQLAAAAEVKSMMDVRASPQVVPGGLGGMGAANAAELVGLQMVPSGALSWPQGGIGQPPPLVNVNRRSNEDSHYSVMHGIPGGNGLLPGRGLSHSAGVRGSISRGTPVYESSMPHLTPAQQSPMMQPRMQEALGQRLSPESAAAALYQQQQNHQQLQHQQMESPSTKMILINDFQTASMMHQRGAAALHNVRQLSPHGMAPPPPRLSPIDGVQALSPQQHMLMNATRPVGVVWPQVAGQLSPAAHHLSPTSSPSRHPAYASQVPAGPMSHHRLSPQSKTIPAAAVVGRSSLETLAQVATDPRVVVGQKYAAMGQHDDDVKAQSMRSPDNSLTAAKLIDAIITSQISRGEPEIKKPNTNILEHLNTTTVQLDGSVRSLSVAHAPRLQYGVAPGPGGSADPKSTYLRGAEMPATSRPPPPSLPPIAETPGSKSLTLGEHIDAIIHEDYNKPPSDKEREMTSAKAIKTLMFSNSSSSEDSPQAPNDTPDSNNWTAPPPALMVNGQLQALGSQSNSNNRPRSYSQGTRGMSKVAPFVNTLKKPSSRGHEVTDKEKARQLLSKSSLRPFALNKNSSDGRSQSSTGSTHTHTSTVQAGNFSSSLTMSTLAATHQTVTSLLTAAPCYPINDAARLNAARSTAEALSPRRVDHVDQSRSTSRSASSDGEKPVAATPAVEQAASDSHDASTVVSAAERGEASVDSNAVLSPKLTIASPSVSPLPPSESGANVQSGQLEIAAAAGGDSSNSEVVARNELLQASDAIAEGQGRSPLPASDAAASEAPRSPPPEVMQIRRPLARLDSYDKSPESELVIDESVPSAEPADGSPAAPEAEEMGTEGDAGEGLSKDAVKASVEDSVEDGTTANRAL